MKMYLLLLLLSFCLPTDVYAQEDDLVFKYLEEKVRRVRMSRVEYIDMTYAEGLIIGKEYRNGPLVERKFYYTKPGKLDSMQWCWQIESEQFVVNKYYYYDRIGRLEKAKTYQDADGVMFDLDLYCYDEAGRADSIIRWQNYKHDPFKGTTILNDVEIVKVSTLSYDSTGLLIKKKNSLNGEDANLMEYRYDPLGRMVTSIGGQFGYKYSGRFRVSRHKYNEAGLLIKVSSRFYDANTQMGKTGKIYKSTQHYRYEYFE